MASKRGQVLPTGDDLLAQLGELGEDSATSRPTTSKSTRTTAASQSTREADPLADLENMTKSRPHTPRPASASQPSPQRPAAPAAPGARIGEDKLPGQSRKSGESARSFHQSFKPAEVETAPDAEKEPAVSVRQSGGGGGGGGGGGWWGGLVGAASAAVKQAESFAKELQKNEEAQRWAEQVKGNVGVLRSYGDELRSRALPTFTSILHTLAPPISSHERLQIHITHDLSGYPSLDPLIHSVFSRVMSQVEGGELLVVQRGHESARRNSSSAAGWSDGPWWRDLSTKRDIGAVRGLVEGTKLVRASAEGYANEFFAPRGGVEEAARQASDSLSESNPTRSSDIFLAIQAINQAAAADLFGGGSQTEEEEGIREAEAHAEEQMLLALFIHDPIHSITFHTLTQALPAKWISWLESGTGALPSTEGEEPRQRVENTLPEDVAEIVSNGGVDPREWVAEWLEETLNLGVGIVAQRYVARRMGVGEGGLNRGKGREEILEAGAGEAARAL